MRGFLRGLAQRVGVHARPERLAADHVKVQQTVVVVVEPDRAGAGALEEDT